jgi:uncharacterized membrane protein
LCLGAAAGGVAGLADVGLGSVLIGWDLFAVTFCVWVWVSIWPAGPEATSEHAVRDDPSTRAADAVILTATGVSVVAIGAVLMRASHKGDVTSVDVVLALSSIILSWLVVHTIFTLKYARHYYGGEDGGIDFNTDDPPRYSDFAYLAFTVGMTFQVSDTNIGSQRIRRTVLRHALIAFPLVTLILASAINLVAGLAH